MYLGAKRRYINTLPFLSFPFPFSGGCQHGMSPNGTVSGGVFGLLVVHVAWLCSVFRSVYASLNGALGLDYKTLNY